MKKLVFTLLTMTMLCLLPTTALAANATYIDENGQTKTATGVTELTQALVDNGLSAGWYVLNTDITTTARIEVDGDVTLILADNTVLTATSNDDIGNSEVGISVNADENASLTVYGQIGNTGKIVASVGTNDVEDENEVVIVDGISSNNAAIGGDSGSPTNLAFYGGVIDAQVFNSSSRGATIGSGGDATGNTTVTIGGQAVINALTESWGAAIGGGREATGETTITIGGQANVIAKATTQFSGAAIGGGRAATGTIKITIDEQAKVDAGSPGSYAAAIGSGYEGKGTINVNIGGQAEISAASNSRGAVIGSGNLSSDAITVTIGGHAKVETTAIGTGAALGSGHGAGGTLSITLTDDAKVTATSLNSGAAIGSGYGDGHYEQTAVITLTIEKNANVTASSASTGVAGIGSGEAAGGAGQEGSITTYLYGGTIDVTGDPAIDEKTDLYVYGLDAVPDGKIEVKDLEALLGGGGGINIEFPPYVEPSENVAGGIRGSSNHFVRNLNLRYVQISGESIPGTANPIVIRRIPAVDGYALIELGLTTSYEGMLTVRVYVGTMYEGTAFNITHTTNEGMNSYSAICDEDGYVAVTVDTLGTFETRLA